MTLICKVKSNWSPNSTVLYLDIYLLLLLFLLLLWKYKKNLRHSSLDGWFFYPNQVIRGSPTPKIKWQRKQGALPEGQNMVRTWIENHGGKGEIKMCRGISMSWLLQEKPVITLGFTRVQQTMAPQLLLRPRLALMFRFVEPGIFKIDKTLSCDIFPA